jgi:hypothetical protein
MGACGAVRCGGRARPIASLEWINPSRSGQNSGRLRSGFRSQSRASEGRSFSSFLEDCLEIFPSTDRDRYVYIEGKTRRGRFPCLVPARLSA